MWRSTATQCSSLQGERGQWTGLPREALRRIGVRESMSMSEASVVCFLCPQGPGSSQPKTWECRKTCRATFQHCRSPDKHTLAIVFGKLGKHLYKVLISVGGDGVRAPLHVHILQGSQIREDSPGSNHRHSLSSKGELEGSLTRTVLLCQNMGRL